jgi:ABC-type amino acid transport substrate-binding protein
MRRGFLGLLLLSTVLAGYAEAAESRLDQIGKTKTIKIAHRTDATPFSFVKNNEVTGYTIDILQVCRPVPRAPAQHSRLENRVGAGHHADTL